MENALIWILIFLVLLIVEATTAVLVSIWFAGGALAAIIALMLGADIKIQIFVFLVVSFVCLLLLRKAAMRSIQKQKSKTNLDRIIGEEIIITGETDKNKTGTALINDVEWKVKSENGEVILKG